MELGEADEAHQDGQLSHREADQRLALKVGPGLHHRRAQARPRHRDARDDGDQADRLERLRHRFELPSRLVPQGMSARADHDPKDGQDDLKPHKSEEDRGELLTLFGSGGRHEGKFTPLSRRREWEGEIKDSATIFPKSVYT